MFCHKIRTQQLRRPKGALWSGRWRLTGADTRTLGLGVRTAWRSLHKAASREAVAWTCGAPGPRFSAGIPGPGASDSVQRRFRESPQEGAAGEGSRAEPGGGNAESRGGPRGAASISRARDEAMKRADGDRDPSALRAREAPADAKRSPATGPTATSTAAPLSAEPGPGAQAKPRVRSFPVRSAVCSGTHSSGAERDRDGDGSRRPGPGSAGNAQRFSPSAWSLLRGGPGQRAGDSGEDPGPDQPVRPVGVTSTRGLEAAGRPRGPRFPRCGAQCEIPAGQASPAHPAPPPGAAPCGPGLPRCSASLSPWDGGGGGRPGAAGNARVPLFSGAESEPAAGRLEARVGGGGPPGAAPWAPPEPSSRPHLWAEPGAAVPKGQPVTVWCQGPPDAEEFRLQFEGRLFARGRPRSPGAPCRVPVLIPALSSHSEGLWSEPSDALDLVVTGDPRASRSNLERGRGRGSVPGPSPPPGAGAAAQDRSQTPEMPLGEQVTLFCRLETATATGEFFLLQEGRPRSLPQGRGSIQAEFPLGPVTAAHQGTDRCFGSYYSHAWSFPSAPVELRVAGGGNTSFSLTDPTSPDSSGAKPGQAGRCAAAAQQGALEPATGRQGEPGSAGGEVRGGGGSPAGGRLQGGGRCGPAALQVLLSTAAADAEEPCAMPTEPGARKGQWQRRRLFGGAGGAAAGRAEATPGPRSTGSARSASPLLWGLTAQNLLWLGLALLALAALVAEERLSRKRARVSPRSRSAVARGSRGAEPGGEGP
ncbi:collagen alpha-1(I) chain-like [Heterocephalus glaber]|uniref:Collagen alpha-1(I) chain-like n=1 Tax=Heterocephalus glaber TaxID=10181 RepID=A0AAX6RXF7_HETGA|nr:collagen alpha-1(I) chain-like [Heterocephalus glaber]